MNETLIGLSKVRMVYHVLHPTRLAIVQQLIGTTAFAAAGSLALLAQVPMPPTNQTAQTNVINNADVLRISFSGTPIPIHSIAAKVNTNGTITILFNQTFNVTGRTIYDAEKEIQNRYVPTYFKHLSVRVRAIGLNDVFHVDGIAQLCIRASTVSEAVAPSGDFMHFSERSEKSQIKLIRADGTQQILEYDKIRRSPDLDPEILPGDKIHTIRGTRKDPLHFRHDRRDSDQSRTWLTDFANGSRHEGGVEPPRPGL